MNNKELFEKLSYSPKHINDVLTDEIKDAAKGIRPFFQTQRQSARPLLKPKKLQKKMVLFPFWKKIL